MDPILLDISSVSTTPLTWANYETLFINAIQNNIKRFIVRNDDIAYSHYTESRFNKLIGQAKIKNDIGGRTIDFVAENLDIYYAFNPQYANQLDEFLQGISQEAITGSFVSAKSLDGDALTEALIVLTLQKEEAKIEKIGIEVTVEQLHTFTPELLEAIDFIIVSDQFQLLYAERDFIQTLQDTVEVVVHDVDFAQLSSLINLSDNPDNFLRSKFKTDQNLKNRANHLIKNYLDIFPTFSRVVNADNPFLLDISLTDSDTPLDALTVAEELLQLKNVMTQEAWWN